MNIHLVLCGWTLGFLPVGGYHQNTELINCVLPSLSTSLITSSGKLPGQFSPNTFMVLVFTIRLEFIRNIQDFTCLGSHRRASWMCLISAGFLRVPKCQVKRLWKCGVEERGSWPICISGLPPPGPGAGGGLGLSLGPPGGHILCMHLFLSALEYPPAYVLASAGINNNGRHHHWASRDTGAEHALFLILTARDWLLLIFYRLRNWGCSMEWEWLPGCKLQRRGRTQALVPLLLVWGFFSPGEAAVPAWLAHVCSRPHF